MTLIKSISGIRGTIGGLPGENLTPVDVVKFVGAYIKLLGNNNEQKKLTVVIGRDARVSGEMVNAMVWSTLSALGVDIIDCGMATTPTVEMAVTRHHADGGIIITASHNPVQWNALKLLNGKGEFISAADGALILEYADSGVIRFAPVEKLGALTRDNDALEYHIEKILALPQVDLHAIRNKKFRVVVDAVNSIGGIAIPQLLNKLGVLSVIELNCVPDGNFAHNPEPLAENLTEISRIVREQKADFGIVVDPDVDRLALVSEDGTMFGEEYTLVAVADYILEKTKGSAVSNMSSSRALQDIAEKWGCEYHSSPVGEINVVEAMKKTNAVIGGEGNGGVIFPDLHFGRDALVGVALFLSALANKNIRCSEFRNEFPDYFMSKDRISLSGGLSVISAVGKVKSAFADATFDERDGLKIILDNEWVHLRSSNTEPIIRIYAESHSIEKAKNLTERIKQVMLT
ncbi:MAG: phosphoglucosamine mutase [Bacteroidetes bacterium]|nr:phosphoglucosamine mutase [Bacteroidota bacterium]MBU1719911.1 phosphoglucosamine mutase [Bacteroidota bacterium]